MRTLSVISLSLALCLSSCGGNTDIVPKRTGYFRIALPERKYKTYATDCPFTFEYPQYAIPLNDSGMGGNPCWINLVFPRFRCNVYMSYLPVTNNLDTLLEECRKFVVEHEVKAEAINEQTWENKQDKVYGKIYDIEGNTASNMQFYLTDSTGNFVRGALYFFAVPNKDSLEPVVHFVKEDIRHLVETFRWKKQ